MEQDIQLQVTNNLKTKRVPKLRFGEFKEGWENFKLESKIDFISGFAFKSSNMKSTRSDFQLIKMSNLYQNELQLDRNPSYWEKINNKTSKYLLKENDIILTMTGTVGKKDYGYSVVINENNRFLLNQRLACLRCKTSESNPDFINGLIKTSRFYYLFFNESKGGTGNQSNVGIEDIRNIRLNFPSLPEQQKIASFLSVVNKKIQQLTRKKELLERYKKGVMQKLFSQELRFNTVLSGAERDKNGYDFPKWETKVLKDLLIEYRLGGNYANTELITVYPLIKMGNLGRGKINLKKLEYIPVHEKIERKDKLQFGDLLFNTRNTLDLVGKVSIWKNELPSAYFNSNLMYMRFENNFFMNFRMNSYEGIKELKKIATGTTSVAAIYTKDLLKVKLTIPSLEEQQKIADFLSRIDTKIEAVSQQITKTQSFKKGLLQQMFV